MFEDFFDFRPVFGRGTAPADDPSGDADAASDTLRPPGGTVRPETGKLIDPDASPVPTDPGGSDDPDAAPLRSAGMLPPRGPLFPQAEPAPFRDTDPLDAPPVVIVAALFEGALGRLPDAVGLNFWTGRLEGGLSQEDLAAAFLASDEFRDGFGNPDALSSAAFVEGLFATVLGRPSDAGGLAHWTGLLDDGTIGREEALLLFAGSDENLPDLDFLDTVAKDPDGGWMIG